MTSNCDDCQAIRDSASWIARTFGRYSKCDIHSFKRYHEIRATCAVGGCLNKKRDYFERSKYHIVFTNLCQNHMCPRCGNVKNPSKETCNRCHFCISCGKDKEDPAEHRCNACEKIRVDDEKRKMDAQNLCRIQNCSRQMIGRVQIPSIVYDDLSTQRIYYCTEHVCQYPDCPFNRHVDSNFCQAHTDEKTYEFTAVNNLGPSK